MNHLEATLVDKEENTEGIVDGKQETTTSTITHGNKIVPTEWKTGMNKQRATLLSGRESKEGNHR